MARQQISKDLKNPSHMNDNIVHACEYDCLALDAMDDKNIQIQIENSLL